MRIGQAWALIGVPGEAIRNAKIHRHGSGRARAKGPVKMPQAALGLSSALTWPTRTNFRNTLLLPDFWYGFLQQCGKRRRVSTCCRRQWFVPTTCRSRRVFASCRSQRPRRKWASATQLSAAETYENDHQIPVLSPTNHVPDGIDNSFSQKAYMVASTAGEKRAICSCAIIASVRIDTSRYLCTTLAWVT